MLSSIAHNLSLIIRAHVWCVCVCAGDAATGGSTVNATGSAVSSAQAVPRTQQKEGQASGGIRQWMSTHVMPAPSPPKATSAVQVEPADGPVIGHKLK